MRRKTQMLSLFILACFVALPAYAELQNIQVGGELRIRGNYWSNTFNSQTQPAFAGAGVRWPGNWLVGRPIGDIIGGQAITSYYDWSERGADYKVIEQRTILRIDADFTNQVAAHVELDSFDVWGEDFRSNWITGADARQNSAEDDVSLYQAYIEVDELFGLPLEARIGRQELVLAGGWLLGNNTCRPEFAGLSYDAIRLTYAGESYSISGFTAKLADAGIAEEDGDTDLMGLYASCSAVENVLFEAYWVWLRDAGMLNDTNLVWWAEGVENFLGLDDYDPTNLHTIALRASGTLGAFDFDANAAYQFGNADRAGFLFKPFLYGDNEAEYSAWAADAEIGYTFDIAWQPRAFLSGAYFDGEDNRDDVFATFFQLGRPESSVSFNRLFSDTLYSPVLDDIGQMSNFWTVKFGVDAHPMESIEAGLYASYFAALATFDLPVYIKLGQFRVPVAPGIPFWTTASDEELGWELGLWAAYHYSEDLTFRAGWTHFFTGSGLDTGNFVDFNGLAFNGGLDDADADYLYAETKLRF